MLLVRCSVKPSKINGLGLFADEDIKKGTVTWRFNPKLDILFSQEDIDSFPKHIQEFIDTYSFFSKKKKKYVLSFGDDRFTNHSSIHNNLDSLELPEEEEIIGVANRDIKIGEEILANYRKFDANDQDSDKEYLNS
jgi:SET domain-containing protein